jgi:hypothetical protein
MLPPAGLVTVSGQHRLKVAVSVLAAFGIVTVIDVAAEAERPVQLSNT